MGSYRWGEWRSMAVQPEPQVTDHPCFSVYTYTWMIYECVQDLFHPGRFMARVHG